MKTAELPADADCGGEESSRPPGMWLVDDLQVGVVSELVLAFTAVVSRLVVLTFLSPAAFTNVM